MGIFSNISGEKGENISTEILAYLLDKDFVPFQKLFHQRVFNIPKCSSDLDIKITTQIAFPTGRPDIIAFTNDSLVIFENKLGSLLSGDGQLINYIEIFDDKKYIDKTFEEIKYDLIKDKYLVLIAPSHNIKTIIKQSDKYLLEKKRDRYDKGFRQYCLDKDIKFKEISWEDILSDLDKRDSLQEELYLFIDEYLNKELNKEEVMILKNIDVPSALTKLFKTISTIKNDLDIKEYNTRIICQSYQNYGFYIEHKHYKCWFGYILLLWESYETPVFIQIRKEGFNDKKDELEILLKEYQFKHDSQFEYVLPFYVDNMTEWNNDLVKILKDFDERLR